MELAIRTQIEELPEGLFLATSDELPGLVAQGPTVAETLEITRDLTQKLSDARRQHESWRSASPHPWNSRTASPIPLSYAEMSLSQVVFASASITLRAGSASNHASVRRMPCPNVVVAQ